jgi:hypothetical protein
MVDKAACPLHPNSFRPSPLTSPSPAVAAPASSSHRRSRNVKPLLLPWRQAAATPAMSSRRRPSMMVIVGVVPHLHHRPTSTASPFRHRQGRSWKEINPEPSPPLLPRCHPRSSSPVSCRCPLRWPSRACEPAFPVDDKVLPATAGLLAGCLMTHKYRGSQQSLREVKPKFIILTQGEPKNIYKPWQISCQFSCTWKQTCSQQFISSNSFIVVAVVK